MITKVVLRNFRIHRKLVFVPSPNVTAITGRTDQGKSAIVHAIRWVAMNKPAGLNFIRSGAERCSVSVFVDGRHVKRVRSKKANHYFLDGKRLSSFGSGVPAVVGDLLRMHSLNFQLQHDPALWLADPPATVTKNLNEIVDLTAIDHAASSLSGMIRETASHLNLRQEDLRHASEERRRVRKAPRMKRQAEAIRKRVASLHRKKEEAEGLREAITWVKDAQSQPFFAPPPAFPALIGEGVGLTKGLARELSSLIHDTEEAKNREREAAITHADLLKEQKRALKEIKICPTCKRPL